MHDVIYQQPLRKVKIGGPTYLYHIQWYHLCVTAHAPSIRGSTARTTCGTAPRYCRGVGQYGGIRFLVRIEGPTKFNLDNTV